MPSTRSSRFASDAAERGQSRERRGVATPLDLSRTSLSLRERDDPNHQDRRFTMRKSGYECQGSAPDKFCDVANENKESGEK